MGLGKGAIVYLLGLVLLAIPIAYLIEPHLHGSASEQMVQITGFVILILPFTLPLLIILLTFTLEASK